MIMESKPWLVGRAKVDMTPKVLGIGMLGYGNPKNFVKGVETPISCRTFWMKNPRSQRQLVIVNMEICFPTQSIRQLVEEEIEKIFPHWNLKPEDLVLTTQHTHSAPSGYTHYALYSMSTPGFCQEVLETYTKAAIKSLKFAFNSLCPGEVQLKTGIFAADIPVAFNRSMKAYNRNKEVQVALKTDEQNLAINREMKLLEFLVDKRPWASINWFAVHCTSIMWRNTLISPDNKGYASLYLEAHIKKEGIEGFVGAFAQGDAGDSSPLYQVPYWKRFLPEKVNNQFKNARANGRLQFEKAREIIGQEGQTVKGDIENELIYRDMSKVKVDPEYLPEYLREKDIYTSSACLGTAFLKGAENAGIDWPLEMLVNGIAKTIQIFETLVTILINAKSAVRVRRKYKSQRPKHIFVESGDKRLLGTKKVMSLVLPGIVDPVVKFFKRMHHEGGLKEHTWTPQILPFQISIIGELAFIALPFEPSTMSGERIRKSSLEILKERSVKEVIILSYANEYGGYITTPEEYTAQCYEGGHTVFGKWTLPGIQTILKELCLEMLLEEDSRIIDKTLVPPVFSKDELKIRKFSPHNF
jgi:neutral ceramidase